MRGMTRRRKRRGDPVSEAAQIVRDATEVDWSRDPLGEYEAAIRARFLRDSLLTFTGRGRIMHLSSVHEPCMGEDLRVAAESAFKIISARVARDQRDAIEEARRAVDQRKPPE